MKFGHMSKHFYCFSQNASLVTYVLQVGHLKPSMSSLFRSETGICGKNVGHPCHSMYSTNWTRTPMIALGSLTSQLISTHHLQQTHQLMAFDPVLAFLMDPVTSRCRGFSFGPWSIPAKAEPMSQRRELMKHRTHTT